MPSWACRAGHAAAIRYNCCLLCCSTSPLLLSPTRSPCQPVLARAPANPSCAAGDIDPAIIPYLQSHGMSIKEVDTLMNKKSGFLGLAGG